MNNEWSNALDLGFGLIKSKILQRAVLAILFGLIISIGALSPPLISAQGGGSVTGIQEYFIPGTQTQMLSTFNDILHKISAFCVTDSQNNCISTSTPNWETMIESRVSIVAYADTSVVLIDRAVNGYVNTGDYDPTHYDAVYNLDQGDVLTLDHLGSDGLVGGDRLVSIGGPIFVVRAGWPTYVGTGSFGSPSGGQILAGYWELYPTAVWGTEYGSPMGEDGNSGHVDDATTKMIIQAQQDNTVINRNNNFVTSLDRGESFLIEAVQVGERITSDKPVSAYLAASGLQSVAMRFFSLTPPDLADHEYILPLSSMKVNADHQGLPRSDFIRLYIYAYDSTSYTIFQGNTAIASGTLAAGETATHNVSNLIDYDTNLALDGSLRVTAQTGTRLQLLAAVDSNFALWDWGFPVVGSQHLVDDYYLPWSPATGPNYPTSGYLDLGHPVFISPVEDDTTIQIDWDNNNVADKTITLNRGQWMALVDDSDRDNTGAHLTGSGPFALAWGQDILADVSDGFDLGYSILPQSPEFFGISSNFLALTKDVSPDTGLPGGFFDVTLALTAGPFDIADVSITDILPTPDFSYHPNSTTLHYPGGAQLALNPAIVGQELTWDIKDPVNSLQDYTLVASETITVTFQMDVAAPYSAVPFPDAQVNNAEGFGQWQSFEFRPTAFDFLEIINDTRLTIVKEATPQGNASFVFTSTVPSQTTFSLQDDGSMSNTATFADLTAGSYTITEDEASFPDEFWALLGITCLDHTGQPAVAQIDVANHRVEVDLQNNQHVTCTFINERANFFGGGQEVEIYLPLILK